MKCSTQYEGKRSGSIQYEGKRSGSIQYEGKRSGSIINVCIALALGLALTQALLGALGGGLSVSEAQGPVDRHVAPSCTGIPNCYPTVQAAVGVARDGDVIKVAAGTYADLDSRVVDWETITQVVYIDRNVTIQGGYTTTNWNVPDPVANPAVLDARGQGRVIYIAREARSTIEGLHITGGDASGLGGGPLAEDAGGGVYVSAGADAFSFSDNRVFRNRADRGGGVYLDNAVATLSHNTIVSNTADEGGGLYLLGGLARLNGNTVAANSAEYGGGLLLWRSDNVVSNGDTVMANSAGYGGGLYLHFSAATLINSVIAHNQVYTAGSGLYLLASSPRLLHTTIVRNSGGDGGGVCVTEDGPYRSSVALMNTILVSHTLGLSVTAGNRATLEATLWGAGAWANIADAGGAGTVVTGRRNYRGDPDFVAPDAGDYHIGILSAALDEGVDAGVRGDIDGDPRPQGSGFDLGADETGLAVSKQAVPRLVAPGAQLNYTIRVTNTSVVAFTVAITDILPDHVTPAGLLTWPAVAIAPGDVWTRTVVITVETGYTGPLTNVVQATTDRGASGVYVETSMAGHRVYLPLLMRDY